MVKQKIVLKVLTVKNGKTTSKAMQKVAGVSGVESVAFLGSDKNQIAVTGEGIDSVELTYLLRRSVGCTELVSVGPVEEKKTPEPTPTPTPEPKTEEIPVWCPYAYPPPYCVHIVPLQVVDGVPYDPCTIM